MRRVAAHSVVSGPLRSVGLWDQADWNIGCLEFDLWLRVATAWRVDYVPGQISRYAWHEEQLSNRPPYVLEHARARIDVIDRAFSPDGFFGANPILRDYCKLSQLEMFRDHLVAHARRDSAAELDADMAVIRQRAGDDPLMMRSQHDRLQKRWSRMAYATPPWLRDRLGRGVKRAARKVFDVFGKVAACNPVSTSISF